MTWPKRIVIAALLLCGYGYIFFGFLYPPAMFWLLPMTAVLLFPLFVFSLEATVRLRWRLLAILRSYGCWCFFRSPTSSRSREIGCAISVFCEDKIGW